MIWLELAKQVVRMPEAAAYYGLLASRNGMACCPFRDDRHPSMKLNGKYFNCLGCEATGDVIGFVAGCVRPKQLREGKKLAYDFGIAPDKPPTATARPKPERPLLKYADRRKCAACGCRAMIAIFWKAGRYYMHPRHRKVAWITGS